MAFRFENVVINMRATKDEWKRQANFLREASISRNDNVRLLAITRALAFMFDDIATGAPEKRDDT